MNILQLTAHYPPNVGGVETHLNDLVTELVNRKQTVTVLTYRPLTTRAPWRMRESGRHFLILRLPWIAGFFYKFVKNPALEFLYLVPGLFLVTPFVVIARKIEVIHAHGLVAGIVGVFWGKILRKRAVVSTHSIYHFPRKGMYHRMVSWLFGNADAVLTLSRQSKDEVVALGIPAEKVHVFTYWVNQDIFHPIPNAKKKTGWEGKFVVLFVGRLIEEKGIRPLLKSLNQWNTSIHLAIAGVGPLQEEIQQEDETHDNLHYLGKLSQEKLPLYYSAADVLIVPSIHDEGFGRVILEALSCGTPIIAADRGGIREAVNASVAALISISPGSITKIVAQLAKDTQKRERMALNAERFAETRYSSDNIDIILAAYNEV
jgi:glycosyltransferase involved in cell wall biosynthesis